MDLRNAGDDFGKWFGSTTESGVDFQCSIFRDNLSEVSPSSFPPGLSLSQPEHILGAGPNMISACVSDRDQAGSKDWILNDHPHEHQSTKKSRRVLLGIYRVWLGLCSKTHEVRRHSELRGLICGHTQKPLTRTKSLLGGVPQIMIGRH